MHAHNLKWLDQSTLYCYYLSSLSFTNANTETYVHTQTHAPTQRFYFLLLLRGVTGWWWGQNIMILFFHFGGGSKLLSSPHQLSFHLHQTHMGHMYRPAALLRFCYRKCNHSWFEAQLILALSCSLTSIHEGYISVWNTTWNPIKRELCTFWKWSEGVCSALEWIVEEKGL